MTLSNLLPLTRPENDKKIARGFAFRAYLPQGSEAEHICILLNSKIDETTEDIYAVFITSQTEKAKIRLKLDPAALVMIDKQDSYSEINRACCIQCASAFLIRLSFDEFCMCVKSNKYDCHIGNPPGALIDRIVGAITDSVSFSTAETRKILG